MSAGLLLYRQVEKRVEVLLVHPGGPLWTGKEDHAWSIPKGECRADEDAQQAAEREFSEELGRGAPPGVRVDLGEIQQASRKHVHAWAVMAPDFSTDQIASNVFEMEWPPRTGQLQSFPEIDRAEWTDIDGARRRLIRGQVELLDRLLDRITR